MVSSFILLKRYSSKNLISGLEKSNSHFVYLISKVYDKSLIKFNLKKMRFKDLFMINIFTMR